MSRASFVVLDSNVLLQDPSCLFQFVGDDLYLPLSEIEVLDASKMGLTEEAQNARQASRWIDALIQQHGTALDDGIPRTLPEQQSDARKAPGRLFFGTQAKLSLIDSAKHLQAQCPERDVVVVSADINTRLKALLQGLSVKDYSKDQVIDDAALLYKGFEQVDTLPDTSETEAGVLTLPLQSDVERHLHHGIASHRDLWRVTHQDDVGVHCERATDYQQAQSVWGIHARNTEQSHALNLLMDPSIDLVTLCGHAGTGKTLLALAAALEQSIEQKRYKEIIVTRVTVPLGEDIGFLPGTEEEKMTPWMGALSDNLEVLCNHSPEHNNPWQKRTTAEVLMQQIKIRSLNFMRGRTFFERFVIVDEAQNLTPKQMKALITRAGHGTKMVCLGNLAQIDTPYLSETTSGLTFLIDQFKAWPHSGHLILSKGERSRLADFASQAL